MKLTGLYSSSPLLFSNTRQPTRLDCSTLTNVFRKCSWNGSEPLLRIRFRYWTVSEFQY